MLYWHEYGLAGSGGRRGSPKQLQSGWHNHLFSLLPPKKVIRGGDWQPLDIPQSADCKSAFLHSRNHQKPHCTRHRRKHALAVSPTSRKNPDNYLSCAAAQTLSISYVKQCLCNRLLLVSAGQISHCLQTGFLCYWLFGSNRLLSRRHLGKQRALLGLPDEVAPLFFSWEERSWSHLSPLQDALCNWATVWEGKTRNCSFKPTVFPVWWKYLAGVQCIEIAYRSLDASAAPVCWVKQKGEV